MNMVCVKLVIICWRCFLVSTGCSHLEMICISWCHLITDSGIEQFTRYCTKLRTFICKGATQVQFNSHLPIYTYMYMGHN